MQSPQTKEWYGLIFPAGTPELHIEMEALRRGGKWFNQAQKVWYGSGKEFHFKRALTILWPEIKWHSWLDTQLRLYLNYRIIGQMGAASTGKSFMSSACVLMDYYCFPTLTTVLVSSTTRESLEMRVLGELKKLHRIAKERYPWLPGNLIEGRQRIVTDDRSVAAEGRDFRQGIVGIACKRGSNFDGMSEFVGIKAQRLRVLAEEVHLMPKSLIDIVSNLNKNPDFKGIFSGNPKDITDALGLICEPAAHLGGWDGGIDQSGPTKTWETRFPQGVCMQFVGTDSPNLDGKLGIALITQKQIDADIAFYGQDSVQYSMMDLGRMPRGGSARRVITRQMCHKYHAMEDPVWEGTPTIKIGFMDAAYRGGGGDRCVFGELEFGAEAKPPTGSDLVSAIFSQARVVTPESQIMALIETQVVPVTNDPNETPEDQIAQWTKERCQKDKIAPENFFFDSTGRGSLMNAFGRIWSPLINGIEFGGTASPNRKVSADIDVLCKDHYFNMVTELWFNVSYIIQAGQFRGLTEDVMIEGCMREWGFTGKKLQVEPKDKMKVKSGRSPDLFDALCAGVAGALKRGFVIKRQAAMEHKKQDRTWKRDLKDRARQHWESEQLTFSP